MHWSAGYLESKGNLVEKEGHIEINNIGEVMKWMDQQPSVILHELAHAYHWRQGNYGEDLTPYLEETY